MKILFNVTKLFVGIQELQSAVADPRSSRQIRKAGIRQNLARLHGGWNRLLCRFWPQAETTINLNLSGAPEFVFRTYSSDLAVIHDILVKKVYDLPILRQLEAETVVDLGSNNGLTALWWRHLYPTARIICVEPVESNLNLLRRNVRQVGNVEIVEAAVAGCDAPIEFNLYDAEWSHSSIERPGRNVVSKVTVRGTTLASLLTELKVDTIDLLKVDIEGAEVEALPQLKFLREAPRLIVAEIHPPYNLAAFDRDVTDAGMHRISIDGWPDNICVAERDGRKSASR